MHLVDKYYKLRNFQICVAAANICKLSRRVRCEDAWPDSRMQVSITSSLPSSSSAKSRTVMGKPPVPPTRSTELAETSILGNWGDYVAMADLAKCKD